MSNIKVIAVTPEAREALNSLPRHVNKGQFLVHFGLVTKTRKGQSVIFRTSESTHPQNPMHTRSIRILVLCYHYNQMVEELGELKIKDL